jgi:chaperonin cofactor prefoldin
MASKQGLEAKLQELTHNYNESNTNIQKLETQKSTGESRFAELQETLTKVVRWTILPFGFIEVHRVIHF